MKDKLEFNEENQINLVVEKDGLKREIFYHGKPIQELIKYKDMWQKLKEWLEEEKHHNEENLKGVAKYGNYYTRFTIENSMISLVLDKMQELEGEDE